MLAPLVLWLHVCLLGSEHSTHLALCMPPPSLPTSPPQLRLHTAVCYEAGNSVTNYMFIGHTKLLLET